MSALDELDQPVRRQFFADQAQAWAARFTWDASADRLAGVLLSEIKHREPGSPSQPARYRPRHGRLGGRPGTWTTWNGACGKGCG